LKSIWQDLFALAKTVFYLLEIRFSLKVESHVLIAILAIVTKIIAIIEDKKADEVPSIGASATEIAPAIWF